MSLALDAIILFTAVFLIWLGTKRGFIRSVMGLVSTVAALFVAYAYTPPLAAVIREKYLLGRITEGIDESLRSIALDVNTDLYNLDTLAENLPDVFTDILERYRIDIDSFAEKLRGLTGCGEDTVYQVAEDIASPVTEMLSAGIAFVLVFLAASIALWILTLLIDLIFKLPVLKTANLFLGFLFGTAEAVVVSCILASLLSVVVTAMGALDPTLFGADVVEETRICRLLTDNGLFDRIADLLT